MHATAPLAHAYTQMHGTHAVQHLMMRQKEGEEREREEAQIQAQALTHTHRSCCITLGDQYRGNYDERDSKERERGRGHGAVAGIIGAESKRKREEEVREEKEGKGSERESGVERRRREKNRRILSSDSCLLHTHMHPRTSPHHSLCLTFSQAVIYHVL